MEIEVVDGRAAELEIPRKQSTEKTKKSAATKGYLGFEILSIPISTPIE